uniref:AB hydrolase-1 domain-containing protein n=1 Tax=Dichanthelium oligosanthes TaxID=888268 RepID=A0A1E5WMR7_9POAL
MAQEIEHTHLPIRGLNLHVAQVGKGELGTVVFLHGFPEIWYSWRHQMLAVAAAAYRAIAPDCRGYGISDQPPEDEEASWDDLVADAFLVGKDFGAMPAYEFALQHPDRTCGVTCLGIPFNPAPRFFDTMPEGFYILRWREPGRAEADFGRYDVRRVVRTVYVLFSGAEIPVAKEGQEIMDLADPPGVLRCSSSFLHGLGRAIHKIPNRLDAKFQVPVFMVMGEKDDCFKFPGFETAMKSGIMENFNI